MDVGQFVPAVLESAEKASVPVVVHLDHGFTFETVMKAIRWGFTSVMFDGSSLGFEQNMEVTGTVCRVAKSVGVSVEAELGEVGGAEGEGAEEEIDPSRYTDPDLAERFVKETCIDALAISVGNAHGFYRKKANLDFDRIREIKKRVGIPLVLHGGSGIPDQDFIMAIRLGISKINFFTGMSYAAVQRIKEFITTEPRGYEWIALEAKKAIKEVVRERMRIFGSSGRG
jgi:fructose-bisphosphate aldolase class II